MSSGYDGRLVRTLAAVALGGVLGAELRYLTGLLLTSAAEGFPWATLVVNIVGGFAMGLLTVVLTRSHDPHPLLQPFLGVGVLGGFTTFSAYTVDAVRLVDADRPGAAAGYVVLTLLGALAATVAGQLAGRAVNR